MNRKSRSHSGSPRQRKSLSADRGVDGPNRDNGNLEENDRDNVYDDGADNGND